MRTVISRHPAPATGRRRHAAAVRLRWLTAWLGLAALGGANGTIREVTYADTVGDHAAHQLSTFTLISMIAGYTWWLQRRWPQTSPADAVKVGVLWVVLTVALEFGFGHHVDGASWATLWADYDVTRGNLWILVLLTIGVAPVLARRMDTAGDGRPARRTTEPSTKGD